MTKSVWLTWAVLSAIQMVLLLVLLRAPMKTAPLCTICGTPQIPLFQSYACPNACDKQGETTYTWVPKDSDRDIQIGMVLAWYWGSSNLEDLKAFLTATSRTEVAIWEAIGVRDSETMADHGYPSMRRYKTAKLVSRIGVFL